MDPEPASASRTSAHVGPSRFSAQEEPQLIEDDDPPNLSGPSIALFGLAIAFATVGVPLWAVLTERPVGRESFVPTALDRDGFKSASPLSFTRADQPRC